MKSQDYIEMLKERFNWKNSDVARNLEITTSSVSAYKYNNTEFKIETALKVAELLKIDPREVVANVFAAKAKSEKEKDFWKSIISSAAGIILFLNVGTNDAQAIDKPTLLKDNSTVVSILC